MARTTVTGGKRKRLANKKARKVAKEKGSAEGRAAKRARSPARQRRLTLREMARDEAKRVKEAKRVEAKRLADEAKRLADETKDAEEKAKQAAEKATCALDVIKNHTCADYPAPEGAVVAAGSSGSVQLCPDEGCPHTVSGEQPIGVIATPFPVEAFDDAKQAAVSTELAERTPMASQPPAEQE